MTVPVNQPSTKPSSKVQAAGIAGASVSVVFVFMAVFWPELYSRFDSVPGSEATLSSWVTGVVMFAAAYFRRDRV